MSFWCLLLNNIGILYFHDMRVSRILLISHLIYQCWASLTPEEISVFRSNGITIYDKGDSWVLNHHGIPEHGFEGGFGANPNVPSVQNHSYEIPQVPILLADGNEGCVRLGPIAMAISGAVFFNPYTRLGYNAVEGTCAETFDNCNGHPAPGGLYHYHQLPSCLYYSNSDLRDVFLGVAFDGYPIYGPMDETGKNWTSAELDKCHGHVYKDRYMYRITLDFPYIMACFRGSPRLNTFGMNRGTGLMGPPPFGRGPPPFDQRPSHFTQKSSVIGRKQSPFDDESSDDESSEYGQGSSFDQRPPTFDQRPPHFEKNPTSFSRKTSLVDNELSEYGQGSSSFDQRPPNFNQGPPHSEENPPLLGRNPPVLDNELSEYGKGSSLFDQRPPPRMQNGNIRRNNRVAKRQSMAIDCNMEIDPDWQRQTCRAVCENPGTGTYDGCSYKASDATADGLKDIGPHLLGSKLMTSLLVGIVCAINSFIL